MTPLKGKLLIAEPFLNDPNFDRSVVFLCQHNANGSLGFVFNQATSLTLSDVIEDTYSELPLHTGGPVEPNTLHFIHRLGTEIDESVLVGNGIYWSGNFEQLKTLLNVGRLTAQDIRFFVGYSGWAAGQLLREMKQKTWIVADADAPLLFDTPTPALWREVLKRKGGEYRSKAHYPTDPRLN